MIIKMKGSRIFLTSLKVFFRQEKNEALELRTLILSSKQSLYTAPTVGEHLDHQRKHAPFVLDYVIVAITLVQEQLSDAVSFLEYFQNMFVAIDRIRILKPHAIACIEVI